jgi:Lrp/AsnC family transcriptional regulator, leucine-responsive regulatory protein
VDQIDRHLLALLRRDGRATMAALGREVGLSRTATLARVRRLEDSGVITAYRAEVAVPQTAAGHVARVAIQVRTPDRGAYVRRLLAIPEVSEVESVAGEYDLLLRLTATSAAELNALLDRIASWRETVTTTSFVVLRTHDDGRGSAFTR